jgi:Mg-chelatase subunit ChlD
MPTPTSHTLPGTPSAPRGADPTWVVWGTAWTRHARRITGRADVSVTVAPGAAGDAPACCWPDTGRIEVNATLIGRPDIADPRRAAHRRVVPAAYGALVHEAAHLVHSRWRTPDGTPPVVHHVATLLEESRAEGAHRTRRRADRQWLRRAVTDLVSPRDAPVDDPWHAGQAAALLLARVDARILAAKDVRAVRAAVLGVLGRKRLAELRDIWRQAHTVDDTDAQTMIDLASRWCHALGIDPAVQPNVPEPDEGEFGGRLAAAVASFTAATLGITTEEYLVRQLADRHAAPAHWTRRDPTDAERDAVRRLAAQLRRAHTEHHEPASQASALPPGRLRTRAAVTAQAQRAAGAVPTTTPWQRRTHLPPGKPTLHLAVLVDVSGSMHAYAAPMSSAAWVLAHVAHRNHAVASTIAFGDQVTLLTPPRHRPTQVLDMAAVDGTEQFTDAVKLADRLLDLRHRRTLRMLAVVSDGWYPDPPAAQKLITTLHLAGCPVLWLHPADRECHTYAHTTTIAVADPLHVIDRIATAAITALANA